jgi:hypothetical protein
MESVITSIHENFITDFKTMYCAMHSAISRISTGLEVGLCHITTQTYTGSLKGSLKFFLSPSVISKLIQSKDAYFDVIKTCSFSRTALEVSSLHAPFVHLKLFNDGAFQMTGCRSHVEALLISTELCRFLRQQGFIDRELESLRLQLLNLNVVLHLNNRPLSVRLQTIASIALKHGLVAELPERPPSCIVRCAPLNGVKAATAMVYKSGKFVVSSPSTAALATCFEKILLIFEESILASNVVVSDPLPGHTTKTTKDIVAAAFPELVHSHLPTSEIGVRGCLCCEQEGNIFSMSNQSKPSHEEASSM